MSLENLKGKMRADDVRESLEGFDRISLQVACKQTRGRTAMVDVWFEKDGVWGQMSPSAVDRMWAGSSLCGYMLRDHFRLSDSEYARVMKDLNRTQGLPGIYRRGDQFVIVVKLPRRRSYEDMMLGGALATGVAVLGKVVRRTTANNPGLVEQKPALSNNPKQNETSSVIGLNTLQDTAGSPSKRNLSSQGKEATDVLPAENSAFFEQYGTVLSFFLNHFYDVHRRILTLRLDPSEQQATDQDGTPSQAIANKKLRVEIAKLYTSLPDHLTEAQDLNNAILKLGNRLLILLQLEENTHHRQNIARNQPHNDGDPFIAASAKILSSHLKGPSQNAEYLRSSVEDFDDMRKQVQEIIDMRTEIKRAVEFKVAHEQAKAQK